MRARLVPCRVQKKNLCKRLKRSQRATESIGQNPSVRKLDPAGNTAASLLLISLTMLKGRFTQNGSKRTATQTPGFKAKVATATS